jgi:hypothetical protein
MHQSGEE